MSGLFQVGQLHITQAVRDVVAEREVSAALTRHQSGDWGTLCPQDAEENDRAVWGKARILSVYQSSQGCELWIVTEAGHQKTTVLLPLEY